MHHRIAHLNPCRVTIEQDTTYFLLKQRGQLTELLEVVRKYVPVDPSQIKVHLDREGDYEILELNITLPDEEPRSGRG